MSDPADELQPWQREMNRRVVDAVVEGQQVLINVPPQHPQTCGVPASGKIVLRNVWRTGEYIVQRPGQPDVTLSSEQAGNRPLDAAQHAAGLTSGYWLTRGMSQVGRDGARFNEWTWVQL